AIPSISSWAEQAPFLTLTLERKLEGLRKSLAIMQEVTNRVEQAASAAASTHPAQPSAEKVVVSQRSLLGVLASTTPGVVLPIVIGLVALVAMITFDDWLRILAAPAALLVIHFTESQLITPALVSRRCALNTVAVFATIAFLGWMWGAIGAIVAVPLLILLSTIAAHLPSLRWLEVLLSAERPVSERIGSKPPLRSPAAAMRLASR